MSLETDPQSSASEALARMWSRRSVLGAGLGGAAALGLAGAARAQGRDKHGSGPQRTPLPRPDLYTLVQRSSHGFTQALWAEAQARGYDGFLDWQLDHQAIPDAAMDAMLLQFPSLPMTARQIRDTYVVPNMPAVPVAELKKAFILRSVYSKRQLYERMVEFWTDHFNIDGNDAENQVFKTVDDREVIRVHALGKFPDLLKASAHSGAMLYYLDNYTNKNTGVNENYSREVMELHTLAPGNYTEVDVRELAEILTGWTIWRQADPLYGTFRYRGDWHDNGVHTLLGQSFGPNGGQAEGEAALDLLANHPATRRFVARKLCRWLLAYEPPKEAIDAVAATFAATGGDIKAMIRTALRPDRLLAAQAATQPKIKRPATFVASLLRAVGATFVNTNSIQNEYIALGQLPFSWSPPDGYPDSAEYWGKSVLTRWNFASRLFDGAVGGVSVDVVGLFAGVSQVNAAQRCNQLLAGGFMDAEDVVELHAFVRTFPSFTTQCKREVLALAASSPSFQTY